MVIPDSQQPLRHRTDMKFPIFRYACVEYPDLVNLDHLLDGSNLTHKKKLVWTGEGIVQKEPMTIKRFSLQ